MTASQPFQPIVDRARSCQSEGDCVALYREWSGSYNKDLTKISEGYVAPVLVAQAALGFKSAAEGLILDAGCGTGLVGEALARGGAANIHGLDLSPDMLEVARKTGVYEKLDLGNMNKPIDKEDNTYDIVTCCGTFTHGHVRPDPALRTLVRMTKKGGIVIATVINDLWAEGGFEAEVQKLVSEGLVKVVNVDLRDYITGRGDKAWLVVLQKMELAELETEMR